MNLSIGIVGFPNAGKSTLFNALLKRQIASTAPYPFCTIEPNKGIVPVPDERLPILAKLVKTEKIVPAVVEFVDIAGLVKNAHKGEGLGNQFLGHIKEVSVIVFVLRTFDLPGIDRAGSTNPREDLMLKDIDTLSDAKEPKGSVSNVVRAAWQTIMKAQKLLSEEKYLHDYLTEEEKEQIRDKQLLTTKDYIICLNVLEADLAKTALLEKEYADLKPVVICAKTEEELGAMSESEHKEYLGVLGIEGSGLEVIIKQAYQKLKLVSFLTAGEIEARAWTIRADANAQEAAGVIHTDFAKNFIKVEVIDWQKLVETGSWQNAREKGWLRLEGKDYKIKDGEVVEFKFN